jgi:hypothetical protein
MSIAVPLTIYGYKIIVPEMEALDFIHDIISINDTLIEPIQVYCITPNLAMLHSNEIQVIIGFIPDNVLSQNMIHLDALREFIMDNPMFDGIDMEEKSGFYTGFIWKDDMVSEVESESESESEDMVSEVESESEDSIDSDDSSDETEDKSTSYYISKYYI